MKNNTSNLQCPSCQNQLKPKILNCEECGIQVEGPFQFNEFATLGAEDLHFLRIFVRCEGRIRDMEPALGLSYPTIRARLSQLKNRLLGENENRDSARLSQEAAEVSAQQTLELLEKGEISFDEAMSRIKKFP